MVRRDSVNSAVIFVLPGFPNQLSSKASLSEHLIADISSISGFSIVDGNTNYPVIAQQLPRQLEPGIHHGAPVAVEATARIGVGLAGKSSLLFVILNGVAELVLINKIVARVVWRVDIDHLDLAVVATLQEFQHLEVVAFNVDVIRVEGPVLAITAAALLGTLAVLTVCDWRMASALPGHVNA